MILKIYRDEYLTANSRSITIFNPITKISRGNFAHTSDITSAYFDEKYIISGSEIGEVTVSRREYPLNSNGTESSKSFAGNRYSKAHTDIITAIALYKDLALIGSHDGSMSVWDLLLVGTKELPYKRLIREHQNPIINILFLQKKNGKHYMAASVDSSGMLYIWKMKKLDINYKKVSSKSNISTHGVLQAINQRLYTTTKNEIIELNYESNEEMIIYKGECEISHLEFDSKNNFFIACSMETGEIILIDYKSKQIILNINCMNILVDIIVDNWKLFICTENEISLYDLNSSKRIFKENKEKNQDNPILPLYSMGSESKLINLKRFNSNTLISTHINGLILALDYS